LKLLRVPCRHRVATDPEALNRTTMGLYTAIVLLLTMAPAGCRHHAAVAEVEGTVRIEGRPLENVLVVFLPDPSGGTTGPASKGVTDAAGRYRLRCEDQRDGAVIGCHRIVLEDLAVYTAPRDEGAATASAGGVSRVPRTYRSAAETPLRAEISPSGGTHDIDIRRQ